MCLNGCKGGKKHKFWQDKLSQADNFPKIRTFHL